MNIRRSALMLALLFAVCVAAGFAIPSTVAYISGQSNILVNTFEAAYVPPQEARVPVTVLKTVHNVGTESISPNGFRFELKNTQNDETFVLVTDASGYATITLPFSDADLGTTYTYRLSEINDQRENVTYSRKVYTIRLTPKLNADNQIVVEATVDGQPVKQIAAAFENIYSAGTTAPMTGDPAQPALYAALMLMGGMGMIALKRKGHIQ